MKDNKHHKIIIFITTTISILSIVGIGTIGGLFNIRHNIESIDDVFNKKWINNKAKLYDVEIEDLSQNSITIKKDNEIKSFKIYKNNLHIKDISKNQINIRFNKNEQGEIYVEEIEKSNDLILAKLTQKKQED